MLKTSLKTLVAAAALMGLAMTSARADQAAEKDEGFPGSFSSTLTFTTNYSFRGLTQTQDDPAFQGSFDWTHPIGFYAGVWGSNIDFQDNDAGFDDDANLEIDAYFGFANSIGNFTYNVGGIYYIYPGANDDAGEYNYWEIAGKFGYNFEIFSVGANVFYSPEFFGETGSTVYVQGTAAVPLPFMPLTTTLDGWVGHQGDTDIFTDYIDWSIGLKVAVEGFNLDFRWVDTNLETDECSANTCKGTFIFSVSRTF